MLLRRVIMLTTTYSQSRKIVYMTLLSSVVKVGPSRSVLQVPLRRVDLEVAAQNVPYLMSRAQVIGSLLR
jgi:hypothetical protein